MVKILLVDDVPGIRRSVSHVLRAAGFDVIEAENGEAAKRMMADESYQLVLTDIIMPECDGGEMIEWMDGLAERPRVIAMSGGAGHATAEQALATARGRANAVLLKPFARQQLLDMVEKVMAAA